VRGLQGAYSNRTSSRAAASCRLLPLICLAPDIVEAIPDGRQPKGSGWVRCWDPAAALGGAAVAFGFSNRLVANILFAPLR